MAALVVLNGIAIWALHSNSANVVAAVGAISSPIVAMVSAYFGIKVGSQTGAENVVAADQARAKANLQVMSVLGQLPPDLATPIMESIGVPVPPQTPPAGSPTSS